MSKPGRAPRATISPNSQTRKAAPGAAPLAILRQLERKVLWLSSWMIHNANHLRASRDGLKVGGHQASSASVATILSALYFHILRPEDRVAVKPHASPVFHAIQYLLGHQSREPLERFRALGGAQAYPSRTKDADDVDFSTGSVGLGAAMTSFAALVQDYLRLKSLLPADQPPGRMVAIVGDAELDEGNIFEALLEGWKHDIRNVWWIIDYNRQSLDSVASEMMYSRFDEMFEAMGWHVITIKFGKLLEAAFKRPDGAALRQWIDDCPNSLYSALCYKGEGQAHGALDRTAIADDPANRGWRQHLEVDLGDKPGIRALLDELDDTGLHRLMTNLAGHDMGAMIEAFESIDDDRPTCFIAYTIKGYGLPFAGHKDNHAGLMNPAQMAAFQRSMEVGAGEEWDRFAGLDGPVDALQAFLDAVPFAAKFPRRRSDRKFDVPADFPRPAAERMATQDAFGRILNELARGTSPLAERIVTTSPDVTVSTNLGAWVNRRGIFDRRDREDVFREEKVVSAQLWEMGHGGQHIELGIAENNLFLQLAALGLSDSLFGARLLPIGTVYDPFIMRGLDALNYACYQGARFMLVATPSGITLAPEGGAHQSIATPLIGMAQDGLAAFEPAFVDELAEIMAWSFDYMQRDGPQHDSSQHDGRKRDGPRRDDPRRDDPWRDDPWRDDMGANDAGWDRDAEGGSVYLRLSTRPVDQPERTMSGALRAGIITGGYWLRPPAEGAELAIVYTGAVAPNALAAYEALAEDMPEAGLLAVTSADRLNVGWTAAGRAGRAGGHGAPAHIETLLAPLARDAGLVTVVDGHPGSLAWLGSVTGHRVHALGVEHFGQAGDIDDLHRIYGIDAEAILEACAGLCLRRLREAE
ncbi:MAG TPA: transketolase [Alphaproteobacteria bacterium]|nr:transketolase [Alphaproteobacteria bacterium]